MGQPKETELLEGEMAENARAFYNSLYLCLVMNCGRVRFNQVLEPPKNGIEKVVGKIEARARSLFGYEDKKILMNSLNGNYIVDFCIKKNGKPASQMMDELVDGLVRDNTFPKGLVTAFRIKEESERIRLGIEVMGPPEIKYALLAKITRGSCRYCGNYEYLYREFF